MRTKIKHDKGRIRLVLADYNPEVMFDLGVLGEMVLHEGTRCWTLTDIRLSDRPMASPYSGSISGEDMLSLHRPENNTERSTITEFLKEYDEMEGGELAWCSYKNIVRGDVEIEGYSLYHYRNYYPAVMHRRSTGLDKLKEMQAFWEDYSGSIAGSKINNPYRQPNYDEIRSALLMRRFMKNRSAPDGYSP